MEKTGYMFAGQGAQFPGMGAKLVESSQAAKKVFEQADAVLGYSISDLCFKASIEELTPCAVCQPTIFTVSVACFKAYTEANPEAETTATAGLSLGEYSAAVAAKVLTFEDGLRLMTDYAASRYNDESIRRFSALFVNTAKALLKHGGDITVGELKKQIAACTENGGDVSFSRKK